MAQVINTSGRILDLLQQPDGPSTGKLRQGDPLIVMYGEKVFNGLVWIEVIDQDGRIGWLPQINLTVVTPTATSTPRP